MLLLTSENLTSTSEKTTVQNLINPILEYLNKPQYKETFAPLSDTILYNHMYHTDTREYIDKNYYKQPFIKT